MEIASSLPRGFQAAYCTWWGRVEVDNGGFHQYFYNRGVDWAFMALKDHQLFDANELAGLIARAIDLYLQDEPEQLQHRNADPLHLIVQYVTARDASTWPELDHLFYEIDNGLEATSYLRSHIDEFVRD